MKTTRPTGLSGITVCYFSTHNRDGARVPRFSRVLVLGIIPIVLGFLFESVLGPPNKETLTLIVAVLAVVAAVLIGLLPLAHSILRQSDVRRKYDAGERPVVQQELDRIQTLQDLHAAISWSVILLVIGLGSCSILAIVDQSRAGAVAPGLVRALDLLVRFCLLILYWVMTSTALTFFDVARGVFETMESQAESMKKMIRANVRPTGDDSVPVSKDVPQNADVDPRRKEGP